MSPKSKHKHVKTSTPYKVVEQYERGFKKEFSKDIGSMVTDYIGAYSKMLSDKK